MVRLGAGGLAFGVAVVGLLVADGVVAVALADVVLELVTGAVLSGEPSAHAASARHTTATETERRMVTEGNPNASRRPPASVARATAAVACQDPWVTSTDAAMLLDHLRGQRRHVLGIIDGLAAADLARAVLPSGWSILGLVHHLALDDERFWMRAVVAGEQEAIDSLSETAWQVPDGLVAEQVFALYRAEAARTDEIIGSVDLDAEPAWWPHFMGERWLESNREVVLHLITETATHAGHLDAVRELIDGRQWMVITE